MREVAADDKQILVCEIGLQHIRYLLQFPEIVRRYDDGHDRRHGVLTKPSLQEWQLHLQTMLSVVCLGVIGKDMIRFCQTKRRLVVHLHKTQWRRIVVCLRVHRSPVEPFVMAGT